MHNKIIYSRKTLICPIVITPTKIKVKRFFAGIVAAIVNSIEKLAGVSMLSIFLQNYMI